MQKLVCGSWWLDIFIRAQSYSHVHSFLPRTACWPPANTRRHAVGFSREPRNGAAVCSRVRGPESALNSNRLYGLCGMHKRAGSRSIDVSSTCEPDLSAFAYRPILRASWYFFWRFFNSTRIISILPFLFYLFLIFFLLSYLSEFRGATRGYLKIVWAISPSQH